MKKYRMSPEVNQSIVNGILQGYKNYIEERKIKRQEMHISTAYAWVRGNHIDDQTAEECKDVNINYRLARAGYSWGYLQFEVGRKMFIIKNAKYFNEKDFSNPKGLGKNQNPGKENYLKQLSRINNNVKFPEQLSLFPNREQTEFLSLFSDETLNELDESEIKLLVGKFDQFYIVTYEIDESTYAISKIRILMPNPYNDTAYEIEEISHYIGSSTVSFDEDDYEVLKEDDFDISDTPAAIEYGIITEEQLNKNKGGDQS